MTASLEGCTVVITREHRGELGRLLDSAGAGVEHIPLIEVVDVDEEMRGRLDAAIADGPDWVIVTSPAGAARVSAVSKDATIRLAAVGSATAERLAEVAGRAVDLIPERQTAASLAEAFLARVTEGQRVVVAHGNLAHPHLAEALTNGGHDVDALVAYRTNVRSPSPDERRRVGAADAVVFASGSAARCWADALGDGAAGSLPGIVVAIGPTTRAVAEESGLKITHQAAEHSLAGIIDELTAAWAQRPCA